MEYSSVYLMAFQALARRMYFVNMPSPETAIALWQEAVNTLDDNAFIHLCELENSLDYVREPIATFLVSDELIGLPEHAFFVESITEVDTKFKGLTVEKTAHESPRQDFRWWLDRVPKMWLDENGHYVSDYA